MSITIGATDGSSTVTSMSDRTAGILFGGVDQSVDMWRPRTMLDAFDFRADMSVARSELLARVEWASAALESYPATPQLPVMELTLPMPVWADL